MHSSSRVRTPSVLVPEPHAKFGASGLTICYGGSSIPGGHILAEDGKGCKLTLI